MPIFPPSGGFIQAIRQSSRELRVAEEISIAPDHINRLLLSPAFVDSFQRVSKNHGLALPLKFSSTLDELNFLSVLSLLNFASGYRVPLHIQTGRGAWDSIRALAFSLYITSSSEGDLISAKGLKTLDAAQIAEFMGISLHVERPHENIPGVVVGELGGPLHDLVQLIVSVLNETGGILVNSGYPNLGSFVLEALQQAGKVHAEAQVEVVLEKLVRAFPGFRDMSEVNGRPIYCFKKALFLIHAITIRFGSIDPPPFPIPSTSHLPVFSDNVLPSLLVHLGVIDLSRSSSLSGLFPGAGSEAGLRGLLDPVPTSTTSVPGALKGVPKEGPIVTEAQAYILRAAAIDACELITELAHSLDFSSLGKGKEWISEMTLPDLDMWIWAVAKDRPEYRVLERFAARDTVYF
ncbi:hypothetical protein M413DRAFT_66024 [Hebeloma cylindrosporum]|uniref:Queuosine 5'-phosphate N-glycosylase/hydrolase n=1 Tax=Hebeloma cylindrosporum TaxID=76867 RepID=A0A0C2Y5Q2_HEBCY|nr:hypothetical protein M413DRAFT_66024 [Hebeloma cylindrosporum h7]